MRGAFAIFPTPRFLSPVIHPQHNHERNHHVLPLPRSNHRRRRCRQARRHVRHGLCPDAALQALVLANLAVPPICSGSGTARLTAVTPSTHPATQSPLHPSCPSLGIFYVPISEKPCRQSSPRCYSTSPCQPSLPLPEKSSAAANQSRSQPIGVSHASNHHQPAATPSNSPIGEPAVITCPATSRSNPYMETPHGHRA